MYKIKGILKGKKYLSRKKFKTEKAALAYAYRTHVYTAKSDKKKKHSITNLEIVKV
ncbi:MAG: hypothetical protein KAJ03_10200 [Gammaproteobacteria bacterium]|nr:hypothetical protein [Gammaproteobacteria bacterium]